MSAEQRAAEVLAQVYEAAPLDGLRAEHAAHHREAAEALGDRQLLQSPETAAELAQLREERTALLALLPTDPLPRVMLGEAPVLRAERAVWQQVADVLGVELPQQASTDVHASVARLRHLLGQLGGQP